MINTGKYTELFTVLHPLAFIFLILFSYATPQSSKAFAQDPVSGTKVLGKPIPAQALEGEFLISFNSPKDVEALGVDNNPEWLKKLGSDVEINRGLAEFSIAHVKVANPASTGEWQNLANVLSSDPNVRTVEPNYIHYHSQARVPNDPLIPEMWYLDRVKAFESWSKVQNTNEDIIVAVVDSGIHGFHDDLRGKIWVNSGEIPNNRIDDDKNGYVDDVIGWNFYEYNNLPLAYLYPEASIKRDENGIPFCDEQPASKNYEVHGTHVAATIASMNNNGIGGTGVAPNVKIMMVKALGGPCGLGPTTSILGAVLYAYRNGAKIINMSLGSYGKNSIAETIYKLLSDQGILIVAAAGNNGVDTDRFATYPAGYDAEGIISVGASDIRDRISHFSNRGERSVDLFAPGSKILNAIPAGQGDLPESGYDSLDGTSMASPVVAGAAALIWAHDPSLTNVEVKAKLMNGTQTFDYMKRNSVSGGRLDILSALNAPTSSQNPKEDRIWSGSKSDDMGGIRLFDNRSR